MQQTDLKHTSAKYLQILEDVLVAGGQSHRAQDSHECTHVETTWIGQDLVRELHSKVIVWRFIL